MQYADIVQESEMQAAGQWLAGMLASVTEVDDTMDVDVQVSDFTQSWRVPRIGESVIATPLRLQGTTYPDGLGVHAYSRVRIDLPAPGKRFTGICGIDDHEYARQHAAPITFTVSAGERVLWTSAPVTIDAPASFAIELDGATELILEAAAPGKIAPADWVNLRVQLADGRTAVIGQPARQGAGFSFTYGGQSSTAFLRHWRVDETREPERDGCCRRRITRTDPATGLAVICDITEYTDFPAIEWGLRLKNTGTQDTPVLEDIRSLDLTAHLGKFPYLHYWTGDYCAEDGYEPFRVPLAHEETYRFAPMGGRPTNRAWPYYNLEYPDTGRGMLVVVGWAGQWTSAFSGLPEGRVHIAAGQELTHFSLHPGEEVRTPLSVLLFYHGDAVRAQNLWRRWMHAYNLPRFEGTLVQPFLGTNWGVEMHQADEASQVTYFDRCVEEGVKPDVWWMDAGWYPCNGTWEPTGTWEVDRARFPGGLRAIDDHVHARGTKSLVWFEPERVAAGTWLYTEHPEWLLSARPEAVAVAERWFIQQGIEQNKLLALGNIEAWRWLVEHVSRLLVDEGIDIYRQDFNFDPLPYWRAADAPDRQGITEIRHVEGYLAFWTELRRRFPEMLIDSCASGGRRNDLETMRLSVPLHKTDYNYADLPAKQAFHHSLYAWIPYIGCGVVPDESAYAFRTAMTPAMITGFNMIDGTVDFDKVRRYIREWRQINHLFTGDYYPLTPYNRDEKHWLAWQFHRPDLGEGMVQAFRRAACPQASMVCLLQGLEAEALYQITDIDHPEAYEEKRGEELMTRGLTVTSTSTPGATMLVYRIYS